jgi:hypothetical protein
MASAEHLDRAKAFLQTLAGTEHNDAAQHAWYVLRALTAAPPDGVKLDVVALVQRAYLAGFNASTQWWNGEFPFAEDKTCPTTDPDWISERDTALRADNDRLWATSKHERVQHIKRGTTYTVIAKGKLQTDKPLSDYADVVVYQCEQTGLTWIRPQSEFTPDRFRALDASK